MTGFSVDWLRLREPFDRAARETAAGTSDLFARVARWRARSPSTSFAVTDLASGHGANLRALAPRLGGLQHWRLVDHDPQLLAALPHELAAWARQRGYTFKAADGAGDAPTEVIGPGFHAKVLRERVDLARDLATLDFGEASLVTASALLDLVSASWLQALIGRAQDARSALWFGLNVDGRSIWDPTDPDDLRMHQLFSEHQRRDKGFGPALGPHAVALAIDRMAGAGYETQQAQTDWFIDGAQAPEMQRAMIEGVGVAAVEQDPASDDAVQGWKARRGARIGATCLRVGHVDIVGTPA